MMKLTFPGPGFEYSLHNHSSWSDGSSSPEEMCRAAKEAGLTPGVLKGELHDAHIYQNHLPQVAQQLQRTPYKLPTVEIPDENWHGMLNWHAKDGFKLKDYICHEKLRGDVAR